MDDLETKFGYGIFVSFSIIASTMVINIALICHIKFSDQTITHLTMRPYFAALFQLLVLLAEVSVLLCMLSIVYKDDIK